MSAPIIGNKTFANPTPGVAIYNISHNQNTGSNTGLLLSLSQSNGVSVVGVKYGGVSMTPVQNALYSGISQYLSTWFLANPASGTHNIEITFSGSLWSPLSLAAYSFTNCGGYGDSASNTAVQDPNNITLNCTQDSIVFTRGQAYQTMNTITIDNVVYTYPADQDFAHNTNSQAWGKLGINSVNTGNVVTSCDASSGGCYSQSTEILGFSTPVTSHRIMLIS